jgi:hypothetical protein
MAAPSSSMIDNSMPPNGHSTANSNGWAGGNGHSQSPKSLKADSRPCMPPPPGDQVSTGPVGGSLSLRPGWSSMVVAFAPSAKRTPSRSSLTGSAEPLCDPSSLPYTEECRSHQSSSDKLPCRVTTSTSSMQPELKARITGNRTTTFALRATVRSDARTAPVSWAGGPDQGGRSSSPRRPGSSSAGDGSKNMTSRYARVGVVSGYPSGISKPGRAGHHIVDDVEARIAEAAKRFSLPNGLRRG